MYNKNYYNKNAQLLNRKAMEYQATLSSISIRLKPELKKKYQKAASDAGMSLRQFILCSMDEKIESMKQND